MAFVDYEKAFDSIQHRAVFEVLRAHGVQEKYINIVKETYAEGTAQRRREKLSGKIKIMKGVRQGDTLSPVMFFSSCRGDLQEDDHRCRHQHQRSKTE